MCARAGRRPVAVDLIVAAPGAGVASEIMKIMRQDSWRPGSRGAARAPTMCSGTNRSRFPGDGHEVANPAGPGLPLRLRNHDVRGGPLRRTGASGPARRSLPPRRASPPPMRISILGSAAGGGFPQWNCNCRNCAGVRNGSIHAHARTQTQIAFTVDSKIWFLIGASPALRTQILATPELTPNGNSATASPIGGIFLPSADTDSLMGLLHLREFQSFFVFATASLQKIVKKENRIFS